MENAYIQVQISGGVWRTYSTVINDSQYILHAMEQLQRQNPDSRIRAVDENNRVLDIL